MKNERVQPDSSGLRNPRELDGDVGAPRRSDKAPTLERCSLLVVDDIVTHEGKSLIYRENNII